MSLIAKRGRVVREKTDHAIGFLGVVPHTHTHAMWSFDNSKDHQFDNG